MSSEREVEAALDGARKALRCLYLEVPAPIADDVTQRVEAAFSALRTAPVEAAGEGEERPGFVHFPLMEGPSDRRRCMMCGMPEVHPWHERRPDPGTPASREPEPAALVSEPTKENG